MSDAIRFSIYSVATLTLWLAIRDPLQQLLFFEGRYSNPAVPYLMYALPGFVFFLIAGAGLTAVLTRKSLKWAVYYAFVAGSAQILFSVIFTEFFVRDWSGAVLIATPPAGVAIGAVIGVSLTTAFWRGRSSAANKNVRI